MVREGLRNEEKAYQQVLGQLYTLAYYAYGGKDAAQDVLATLLRACSSELGAMNADEFLLYGMKYIYKGGLVPGSRFMGIDIEPVADCTIRALSTLGFEERMTLLLYARHGMTPARIARVTGRRVKTVRHVIATALQRSVNRL